MLVTSTPSGNGHRRLHDGRGHGVLALDLLLPEVVEHQIGAGLDRDLGGEQRHVDDRAIRLGVGERAADRVLGRRGGRGLLGGNDGIGGGTLAGPAIVARRRQVERAVRLVVKPVNCGRLDEEIVVASCAVPPGPGIVWMSRFTWISLSPVSALLSSVRVPSKASRVKSTF